MVDTATGQFKDWARVKDQVLAQAERQIRAADGASIEWRFSDESVADAVRDLFEEARFDIDVVTVE
jgi:hypothetical protein